MAEFIYNNSKNTNTDHILFELNYGYHPCVFFEGKYNVSSRSSSVNILAMELRELINVCYQNLFHAQDLHKQAYDTEVKPWNYASGEKVWFNSKFIKTKRNWKLKAKFFGPFRVLHLVGKQAYNLELLANWEIHNMFHVSLLK